MSRRRRVLFTCLPGLGHLYPLVPFARALDARGYDVAFACSSAFAPFVTKAGFQVFSVGENWLLSRVRESLPWAMALTPAQFSREAPRRLFAGPQVAEMARDLIALCRSWRPHLVVRDASELGAYLAATKLGIQHATIGYGIHFPPEGADLFLGGGLAELRSAFGLEDSPLDRLYGDFYADLVPPRLQIAGPRQPNHAALRPTFVSDESKESFAYGASYLGQARERPLVYVTLGTVYSGHVDIYRTIIDAFATADHDVVISMGGNDPAQLGQHPPHVTVRQFVPQHEILSRCDVVVHHGGYGTTMETLLAGRPSVIIPISGDQPFFAIRCHQLHVAIAISSRSLAPETIRHAVLTVTRDSTYRTHLQELGEHIRQLPDLEVGVARLADLAGRPAGVALT